MNALAAKYEAWEQLDGFLDEYQKWKGAGATTKGRRARPSSVRGPSSRLYPNSAANENVE